MNCSDVSNELINYLNKRGVSSRRDEVERHLAGCAECRLRAEQFHALSSALDELPTIEPSFGFDARVRQLVATEPARKWFDWFLPQQRLALSGALLAVLAVWMVKVPEVRMGDRANVATVQQEDFNAIKNLDVLENYDVVTSMDALSELAPAKAPGSGLPDQPSKAESSDGGV